MNLLFSRILRIPRLIFSTMEPLTTLGVQNLVSSHSKLYGLISRLFRQDKYRQIYCKKQYFRQQRRPSRKMAAILNLQVAIGFDQRNNTYAVRVRRLMFLSGCDRFLWFLQLSARLILHFLRFNYIYAIWPLYEKRVISKN